jgi:hypothetical protein
MKKSLVAYQGSLFVFLLSFVIAGMSYSADDPDGSKAPDPALLSNQWIHAEIDAAHGGGLIQLVVHKAAFLHTRSKSDQFPAPGSSVVLYEDHPLKSKKSLELPAQSSSECIKGASDVQWRIKPEKSSPISMEREYSMSSQESAFCVTTTITNNDKSPISFFPTEVVKFDTMMESQPIPNTMTYFYSPMVIDKNGKSGFEIVSGTNDKNQFSQMPNEPIFITRYMAKSCEVKLTNDKQWFAFQNLLGRAQVKGGTVCSLEYGFPKGKPEFVRDNLILYVSGMESSKENQTSLDPYIRVSYVLGKVKLKPGESFVYTTRWTAVCCEGPIINVRQGVVFNKQLEVLIKPDMGAFINFANLGVPQEGNLAFLFFNKNGEMRKIKMDNGEEIPQMVKADITQKRSMILPFLPTPVSAMVSIFTADDLRDDKDTFAKLIEDQVQTVRMVLIDKDRNVIRELDRFSAPFKVYDKPVY